VDAAETLEEVRALNLVDIDPADWNVSSWCCPVSVWIDMDKLGPRANQATGSPLPYVSVAKEYL
jgi:hypothetical protein